MNRLQYDYLKIPPLTGDVRTDAMNFLSENNKEKIFLHSEEVARTAEIIAGMYSLDKNVCKISAYLHDISAAVRPDDMLGYIKKNNLFLDEAEKRHPFLLHQRISEVISRERFDIRDERILSAVECHSTLKSSPSPYDMALFVADKLSWDQDGQPPFYDIVSEALGESLEKASAAYIDFALRNKLILYPHSRLAECRNYFANN